MNRNIRSERVRIGLTAKEAAQRIGVHANTLLSWERGESEPDGWDIEQMTSLFGCSADYLLGLTEERLQKTAPIVLAGPTET